MVVTLLNDDSTYDFVTFNTIIEGCGNDSVYITGEVAQTDYAIYNPAQPWSMVLTIAQDYSLCPLECTFSPLSAIPSDTFFTQELFTPTENPAFNLKQFELTVSSSFVPLDASFADVRVTCFSSDAYTVRLDNGQALKSTDLRVNFEDACQYASITGATRGDETVPLYAESFLPLIGASHNLANCQPMYNILRPISSSADQPATLSLTLGPNPSGSIYDGVFLDPLNRLNLGEYLVQIETCLPYGNSGQATCVLGAPFTILI